MVGKQRVRRRTFGLATLVLVLVAAVSATSCSTRTTSTVTLTRSAPGTVSAVIGFNNAFQATGVEVRLTSGTGRLVTAYDLLNGPRLSKTLTDGGADGSWTRFGTLQDFSIPQPGVPSGSFPGDPVYIRLSAPADADLELTVEVRGVRTEGTGDVEAPGLYSVPATGDCARAPAHTDLRSTDLAGADLHNCNLAGSTLDPAKLAGANLTGADLSGATILPGVLDGSTTGTKLGSSPASGATMSGVTFRFVGLSASDLTDVDLRGSTFDGVNFRNSILDGARFSGSTFTNVGSGGVNGSPAGLPTGWVLRSGYLLGPSASLHSADLQGVDLSGLDLSGSLLDLARLHNAKLIGTDLSGSSLQNAWFQNADLAGADLSGANAKSARFDGASLAGTNLTNAQLADSYLVGSTGTPIYPGATFTIGTLEATCPDGTGAMSNGGTCQGHPWP